MHRSPLARCALSLGCVCAALLAGTLFAGLAAGGPASAGQPDPEPTWKSFRTVWSAGVGNVRDLLLVGDRLYYVTPRALHCRDLASGRERWQTPLTGEVPAPRGLHAPTMLAESGGRLYLSSVPAPGGAEVWALDAETGARLWNQRVNRPSPLAPLPAGDLLIVRGPDPGVVALRQATGETAWTFPAPVINPAPGVPTEQRVALRLSPDDDAVILLCDGDLRSVRLADGALLWQHEPPEPRRPVVASGLTGLLALGESPLLYVFFGTFDLQAIDSRTGETRWSREANWEAVGASNAFASGRLRLEVHGDTLLAAVSRGTGSSSGTLVGLRTDTGETAWVRGAPARTPLQPSFRPLQWGRRWGRGAAGSPFVVWDDYSPPQLEGRPFPSLALPEVETLIALDPATGAELWRWQPPEGHPLGGALFHPGGLLVYDNHRLLALTPGEPEPLPAAPRERRELAERLVPDALDVPPGEAWPPRTRVEGSVLTISRGADLDDWVVQVRRRRAVLTLLRLGRDSVEPILAVIAEALPGTIPTDPDEALRAALRRSGAATLTDLLVDLNDPAAVPRLADFLHRARDPSLEHDLARALIQWGDPRAAPALFGFAIWWAHYSDSQLAYDALHWLASLPREADPRFHDRFTAYLLDRLEAPGAPAWVRNLARFALLHDRGPEAYLAARATLVDEPTARLVSADPDRDAHDPLGTLELLTGRPGGTVPDVDTRPPFLVETFARGEDGTHWRLMLLEYVGLNRDGELWVLQSEDGVNWTRPAFVSPRLGTRFETSGRRPRLEVRPESLVVGWQQVGTRPLPEIEVTLEDLYRDSDGDGLTDRLEEHLGTDPHNPDTSGNGIPDGQDQYPTLRQLPLREGSQVYEAVLETLAQAGRANRPRSLFAERVPRVPPGFGTELPLVVVPAEAGWPLRVRGHRGVVLTGPRHNSRFLSVRSAAWNVSFGPPALPVEGVHEPPGRRWTPRAVDFFVAGRPGGGSAGGAPAPRSPVYSADGRRARVGVTIAQRHGRERLTFDVEVRKVGERWYPAECRYIPWERVSEVDRPRVVTPLRAPGLLEQAPEPRSPGP